MQLKTVFLVSAVVLLLLGIGLALFPVPLISMRTGSIPGDLATHIARQFGILAAVLGWLAYQMRIASSSPARGTVRNGLLIAFILLPLETAYSILRGYETKEGFVLVVLFGLLALGLAFGKDD